MTDLETKLAEALRDMRSGWRYIRETHGDLYGVGWDRAEQKADAALEAYEREKAGQAPMVAGFVCKECGKPAMRAVARDPFGKSDARDWWCNDHGPRTFIGTQP